MVNITDVSRLANVSKATVSRVLSGSRGVREESRLAVLQAAEQLNFRPNATARSLATQETNCVGIILSSQLGNRLASLLPLLEDALVRMGKSMLVRFADNASQQQKTVDELLGGRCDGVLVLNSKQPLNPDERIVQLDGVSDSSNVNISYDLTFATESACRFLLGKGHRQIVLMLEDKSSPAGHSAIQGYQQALQQQSIPINTQLIMDSSENQQALLGLLNSYQPFTAIVVQQDAQAADAMRLLREFNLAIPNDISIMSLEGTSLAEQLNPPLTCIEYPVERLVQDSVHILLAKNKFNMVEQKKYLGKLVVRESVVTR
ncbi:LacI family DNA-binding transcriptional regulator [Aeromonas veronii]|uniref:LacI family DNA-binding transcriptional regulator n=1 Tax=Aeromonas veronii TaxID=654 RepID=UPI001F195FAF|nr:LacI family DNA-binding transcriptional regulator [Aeromonas veronii]MCF5903271.1 LacI family transcriptional regulator [Aeromonas veronii]